MTCLGGGLPTFHRRIRQRLIETPLSMEKPRGARCVRDQSISSNCLRGSVIIYTTINEYALINKRRRERQQEKDFKEAKRLRGRLVVRSAKPWEQSNRQTTHLVLHLPHLLYESRFLHPSFAWAFQCQNYRQSSAFGSNPNDGVRSYIFAGRILVRFPSNNKTRFNKCISQKRKLCIPFRSFWLVVTRV